MGMVARRIRVRGTVTGVGFRWSTAREAHRYPDLAGYVRNEDSRTVECVLQGEEASVSAIIEWLRHGPPGARVTDIAVSDIVRDSGLTEFRIAP